MMTLPRHYWLDSDNVLQMAPVSEVESLRSVHHRSVEARWRFRATSEIVLDGVEGKAS